MPQNVPALLETRPNTSPAHMDTRTSLMNKQSATIGTVVEQPAQSDGELAVLDERLAREWRDDMSPDEIAALHTSIEAEVTACAADINRAAENGDLSHIRARAHFLNGMAGTIGALRLASVARRLERTDKPADHLPIILAELNRTIGLTLAALGR